jgi:hypothetical protein
MERATIARMRLVRQAAEAPRCASKRVCESVQCINARQARNQFAVRLRMQAQSSHFGHPGLIHLPYGSKQSSRRRHLRYASGWVLKSSACPCDLPCRRQPEMHPQRHVDQDDLRRPRYPVRDRCFLPQAVYHPRVALDELGMLARIHLARRQFPALLPEQSIDLDMRQPTVFRENACER